MVALQKLAEVNPMTLSKDAYFKFAPEKLTLDKMVFLKVANRKSDP